MQGIFLSMMGKLPQSIYHVGLQGNRILFALAELVIAWRLVESAAVAHEKLGLPEEERGCTRSFYQGKIAAARFFCTDVLPGLTLVRKLVEKSSLDLMEVPEDAF